MNNVYYKNEEGTIYSERDLMKEYGRLIMLDCINPARKPYLEFKASVDKGEYKEVKRMMNYENKRYTFKMKVQEYAIMEIEAPNENLACVEAKRRDEDGEVDLDWEDSCIVPICSHCHKEVATVEDLIEVKKGHYCKECAELMDRKKYE